MIESDEMRGMKQILMVEFKFRRIEDGAVARPTWAGNTGKNEDILASEINISNGNGKIDD